MPILPIFVSPESFPHVSISPTGQIYIDTPDGFDVATNRVASALENRLYSAFHSDLIYPKGLLHLATVELESTLPGDFNFLRTFAKRERKRKKHRGSNRRKCQ